MEETIMLKLAIHSPNFEDGTSFYRASGPFSALRKEAGIDIVFLSKWTAATVSLVDVVLIQRPYDDTAVQIAQIAKLAGRPVVVDYDDDVFAVGMSHPFAHVYNSYQVKSNVQTCLALADAVFVSTQKLKEVLAAKTKTPIYVIPNALDFSLPVVKARKVENPNPIVVFRGSASHEKDLLEVSVEIIDVFRANPQIQFHAIGYLPWFIAECLPQSQFQFTPWADPFIYLQKLAELRPKLVIHPLEKNPFNESKSNCSWLEATMAGSPFLTRNLPEFAQPGCLTYNTPDEFKEAFEKVIKDEYPAEELVEKSWQRVIEAYDLKKVNVQRLEVLYSLVGH